MEYFVGSHYFHLLQVLIIIDSSYHILNDEKNPTNMQYQEKKKQEQKQEKFVNYSERFAFNIPYIGVSLINSYPQVDKM